MSDLSDTTEPLQARMAALRQQDPRARRPTQIQIGDTAVAVSHADFGDARIYVGHSIHVELIQTGQGRPFADTTWEAQLELSFDLTLAEIEQAAIALATALLRPQIPMSVVMLRRDAPASWRVIVNKPYYGWD